MLCEQKLRDIHCKFVSPLVQIGSILTALQAANPATLLYSWDGTPVAQPKPGGVRQTPIAVSNGAPAVEQVNSQAAALLKAAIRGFADAVKAMPDANPPQRLPAQRPPVGTQQTTPARVCSKPPAAEAPAAPQAGVQQRTLVQMLTEDSLDDGLLTHVLPTFIKRRKAAAGATTTPEGPPTAAPVENRVPVGLGVLLGKESEADAPPLAPNTKTPSVRKTTSAIAASPAQEQPKETPPASAPVQHALLQQPVLPAAQQGVLPQGFAVSGIVPPAVVFGPPAPAPPAQVLMSAEQLQWQQHLEALKAVHPALFSMQAAMGAMPYGQQPIISGMQMPMVGQAGLPGALGGMSVPAGGIGAGVQAPSLYDILCGGQSMDGTAIRAMLQDMAAPAAIQNEQPQAEAAVAATVTPCTVQPENAQTQQQQPGQVEETEAPAGVDAPVPVTTGDGGQAEEPKEPSEPWDGISLPSFSLDNNTTPVGKSPAKDETTFGSFFNQLQAEKGKDGAPARNEVQLGAAALFSNATDAVFQPVGATADAAKAAGTGGMTLDGFSLGGFSLMLNQIPDGNNNAGSCDSWLAPFKSMDAAHAAEQTPASGHPAGNGSSSAFVGLFGK